MNSCRDVLGFAFRWRTGRTRWLALTRCAALAFVFWAASGLLAPRTAHAGSGQGHHAVFAHIFGSAGLLGAAYDYRGSALSGRIGVATLPTVGFRSDPLLVGPFGGLSGHVGRRHSLELGIEMTFLARAETVGSFLCGYRYEPNSGFFFRGLAQFMIRTSDGATRPFPAFSLGYSW